MAEQPQVAFDRGRFETDFTDFGKMLEDFGTITLALDAHQANEDWHAESTMGVEIRTSLLVGEKNPFSLTFVNYDFEYADEELARKHWESERDGWKSFAKTWASSHVEGLRPRFDTIIDPFPFQMTSAGSEFEDIRIALGTQVGDDFAQLEYSQSHWHGQAASNFFENFYNPFPQCVLNEAWVSEMLGNACNASKAVLDMGRTSAMNTVSAMKTRVEQALAAQQDAHSISPTEFLTVAAEILKVIDLLPIAIPDHLEEYVEKFQNATGDARKGAAALIGYADKAIPKESTITQSAATQRPEGLVGDFSTAIDKIQTNLEAAWTELDTKYLTKVDHNIKALEELKLLWLPRPDIASGPGTPGGFHHESSTQYT
jgi:hypothetical protein